MRSRADLYISVDIEADGPIPGRYSMLSIGLCCAARFDGTKFEPYDPQQETFYCELKPISAECVPEALRVSGLDREGLKRVGKEPNAAMGEAYSWVERVAGADRPVVVAFPLAFDWMFLYWYFVNFGPHGSPFEFSSALDIKTMLARSRNVVLDEAGKSGLPEELRGKTPHTHNALDDAIEQAEVFVNLWQRA